MTQPYKICPQCQQSAAMSAPVCLSCRRVYRTTAPAMATTQSFPAPFAAVPLDPQRNVKPLLWYVHQAAKWGAVAWSVLCLIGLIYGIGQAGETLATPEFQSEASRAGGSIGFAIGLGLWAVIWIAVAGPVSVVALCTRPKG